MSVVDDLRKLIQDLVAPDLRAIHAQLEGLEKSIAAKLEAIEAKLNSNNLRIESLESKMDLKFSHLESKMDTKFGTIDRRFDQVVDYTKMRDQMDELQKWRQEMAVKTTQH